MINADVRKCIGVRAAPVRMIAAAETGTAGTMTTGMIAAAETGTAGAVTMGMIVIAAAGAEGVMNAVATDGIEIAVMKMTTVGG
jgi:hypothetical protein